LVAEAAAATIFIRREDCPEQQCRKQFYKISYQTFFHSGKLGMCNINKIVSQNFNITFNFEFLDDSYTKNVKKESKLDKKLKELRLKSSTVSPA
jgi:uncharacterized protein (DUF1015 family)